MLTVVAMEDSQCNLSYYAPLIIRAVILTIIVAVVMIFIPRSNMSFWMKLLATLAIVSLYVLVDLGFIYGKTYKNIICGSVPAEEEDKEILDILQTI